MEIINPDLFLFFSKLKRNNNREWFQSNKAEFKKLESEVRSFVKKIEENLQNHDKIEKSKIFRIYRDVRFSNNKTPYKNHFGIAFHREKPYLRGGYYLHLEPENSFLGVGFWAPNTKDLFRIRKELEFDAAELETIILTRPSKNIGQNYLGMRSRLLQKGFLKNTQISI